MSITPDFLGLSLSLLFPPFSPLPPLPPLEKRNIPSSPSLASDSGDDAGLSMLSQTMSYMRPSSSPVRRYLLRQDGDAGSESDSDSDMYVDDDEETRDGASSMSGRVLSL